MWQPISLVLAKGMGHGSTGQIIRYRFFRRGRSHESRLHPLCEQTLIRARPHTAGQHDCTIGQRGGHLPVNCSLIVSPATVGVMLVLAVIHLRTDLTGGYLAFFHREHRIERCPPVVLTDVDPIIGNDCNLHVFVPNSFRRIVIGSFAE